MPNWCSGFMKIRGRKQDILDFFKNEVAILTVTDVFTQTVSEAIFEEKYDEYIIKKTKNQDFYLKNSDRFFFEDNELVFYDYGGDYTYINLEIQQAWAIDVHELLIRHSKKYNLDFNIYANERGMEFEQYITIVGGEVIRDDVIKYDDFEFEAINPSLGG